MNRNRAAVFAAVMWHWRRHGRAPTTKEICLATGLRSIGTVNGHLQGLRADGLVEWEPDTHGTVHPTVTVAKVG